MSIKRVAVLYSELAGYTLACLKALKQHHDVETLVFYWPPAVDAPFDFKQFEGVDHAYSKDNYTFKDMLGILEDFDPHIIKVSGWMDQDYLKIGRLFKKRGVHIVSGLDAPWTGSLKQTLFSKLSPLYLKRHIDTFWVTGERQAQFARRFGYTGKSLQYGLYCCDWDKFSSAFYLKDNEPENAFLFVGRYIEVKGIRTLVEAYKQYQKSTVNPWKLYCAGTGELKDYVESVPEIENVGFIQPSELPNLMGRCRALVLPSLFEPWGVVIQEAAAAGLPVICSDTCGASSHLVQDGYNGFIFEAGNTDHLRECFIRMTNQTLEEYTSMSESGFELSKQFKPARWANTLMNMIRDTELTSIVSTNS